MFSCRGEKKNGSHARRCAGETPAWGLLEGDSEGKGSSQHCGGEQWEEHAVILHVTLMRTRVPSRLRGCTMQRKWITNNVAMLSNNTVSWSCHCCLETGQKVPSKAATSAFYLFICCQSRFLHLSSSRSASGLRSCQSCWWPPSHLCLLFPVCFLAMIWLSMVIFLTICFCCFASGPLKYILAPAQHFSGNLPAHVTWLKMPHPLRCPLCWPNLWEGDINYNATDEALG